MSWSIYLQDEEGNTIETDKSRTEGGTYQVGGTTQAELNVTYNYSQVFKFSQLHDMKPIDAAIVLLKRLKELKLQDIDPDYWKPTEGNVAKAMMTLLEFCVYAMYNNIEAKFRVS